MSRSIRAVTFDFWNTLVVAPGSEAQRARTEHWVKALADVGHERTHEEIGAAFAESWKSFNEAWRENRQYQTEAGVNRVLEILDLAGEQELAEVLIGDYAAGALEVDVQPTPNIGVALAALRDAGVKVGIICDVGITPSVALRGILERHGLMGYFDHHSFSDDVGIYKPDPAIFAHAAAGLGAVPETSAHIGDLRRTDVAGAQAVGWTAVRYSGVFDDNGSTDGAEDVIADHVISDHADLAGVLGLA